MNASLIMHFLFDGNPASLESVSVEKSASLISVTQIFLTFAHLFCSNVVKVPSQSKCFYYKKGKQMRIISFTK